MHVMEEEGTRKEQSGEGTPLVSLTYRNNHIVIETPGQSPPHGPTLAELCVGHFRHLKKQTEIHLNNSFTAVFKHENEKTKGRSQSP